MQKNKEILRKVYKEIRLKIKKSDKKRKSLKIWRKIKKMDIYKNKKTIMFYYSKENEVDTRLMIEKSIKDGKRVILPKIINGELFPIQIEDLDNLREGPYGIKEPSDAEGVDLSEIELIFVPGIVFDKKGYRIGYGGGYYDRFLSKLPSNTIKIGLAFSEQIIEQIPHEDWDIRMDILVTDKEVIYISD